MSHTKYDNSPLHALDEAQWEALCDGCGKCCLVKLQDEDTDEVAYTNVHCEFLNKDCRCSVYAKRSEKKPGCIVLRKDNLEVLEWLPSSCAYRRFHEGKPALPKMQVKINFPLVNELDVDEQNLVDYIRDDV